MGIRGHLTETTQEAARAHLGRDIIKDELRLMPYIQNQCMNAGKIQLKMVNVTEQDVMAKWKAEGYGVFSTDGLRVSKVFWDAMSAILWASYANPGMTGEFHG